MDNIIYLTLAAVRDADPDAFDAAIFSAVRAAAKDVGELTLISAFDNNNESPVPLEKAA